MTKCTRQLRRPLAPWPAGAAALLRKHGRCNMCLSLRALLAIGVRLGAKRNRSKLGLRHCRHGFPKGSGTNSHTHSEQVRPRRVFVNVLENQGHVAVTG